MARIPVSRSQRAGIPGEYQADGGSLVGHDQGLLVTQDVLRWVLRFSADAGLRKQVTARVLPPQVPMVLSGLSYLAAAVALVDCIFRLWQGGLDVKWVSASVIH